VVVVVVEVVVVVCVRRRADISKKNESLISLALSLAAPIFFE
jgi:hypothetical protein